MRVKLYNKKDWKMVSVPPPEAFLVKNGEIYPSSDFGVLPEVGVKDVEGTDLFVGDIVCLRKRHQVAIMAIDNDKCRASHAICFKLLSKDSKYLDGCQITKEDVKLYDIVKMWDIFDEDILLNEAEHNVLQQIINKKFK